MRKRFISSTSGLVMVLGLICLTARPVWGQVKDTPVNSAPPRTPDRHPDLQGTYDLATMTPLERQPGAPAFLTKEKAEALQKAEIERRDKDNQSPRADRSTPVGDDKGTPTAFYEALEEGAGGPVGFYNRFWLNPGGAYNVVNGQVRTSIVVEPADGHLPSYNSAALNGSRRPEPHRRPRLPNARMAQPRRPVRTTIRSSGRSASAACSDSVLLPVRRHFRIISTTICIRLCKLQTQS